MAYATVTLSGTYQTPDGTPHKGHVEIIPSERVIKDTTGDVILTGRVKVDLDAQGAFSVALPATDDPTLNPTGFGYTIAAKLHSSHPPAVSFSLPAALGATTVEDVTPVDPSTFEATATYADASTVTALDSRVTTLETTPAVTSYNELTDTPDLATVATSGNYTDLAGQPSIPSTAADINAERRRPLPWTQASRYDPPAVEVNYRPTTKVSIGTSSTSFTDVDATNLKVTFIAPPSGRVRYRISAGAIMPPNGAGFRWALRNQGGTILETVSVIAYNEGTVQGLHEVRTLTGEFSTDGTQSPLVPGKTYTVTLAHSTTAAGEMGYTQYGGAATCPASIRIEPVPVHLTERQQTATLATAPGFIPTWLCHDRTTFLGTNGNTWRVSWSTDDGASWLTNVVQTFPQNIQHVIQVDDGEIIVFVGAYTANPMSIWRSTGWATDPTAATFTKALDAQGPDSSAGAQGSWRTFSTDTWGEVVIAAEYGAAAKTYPGNMARYLYLSEDFGQTWATVFDLADYFPNDGAHLHGAAYDPWWDALWVTAGDNPNIGTWVSFDRGTTWQAVNLPDQCTTVKAMPECVLFVTDQEGTNRVWRLPRISRNYLTPEVAYTFGTGPNLTHYGNQAFQLRSVPGAPLLLALEAETNGGAGENGLLLATYDGITFKEVWRDTLTYQDKGLRSVAGPSKTGAILGRADRTATAGSPNAEAEMLKVVNR